MQEKLYKTRNMTEIVTEVYLSNSMMFFEELKSKESSQTSKWRHLRPMAKLWWISWWQRSIIIPCWEVPLYHKPLPPIPLKVYKSGMMPNEHKKKRNKTQFINSHQSSNFYKIKLIVRVKERLFLMRSRLVCRYRRSCYSQIQQ